jgi:hypothetical protein
VSFDPHIEDRFAPRRVAAGAAAPPLPVLARLPRVGARTTASAERLPTYAALEPEANVQSPPSLRVVDPTPADLSPLSYTTRVDAPQVRRPVSPTESAANSPRAFDLPAFDQRTSAADRPKPPRREQHRIDAADHVHGSHYGRRPSSAPLSAQVAHWHAALAPRAGVAATVVVILAVSLLYWFTVGRRHLATDAEERMDLPSAWSSESF